MMTARRYTKQLVAGLSSNYEEVMRLLPRTQATLTKLGAGVVPAQKGPNKRGMK